MSEEYNKHTVVELKALLTEKGLPVTGKKAELVQRLVENDTGVPQVATTEITREGNNGGEVVGSSASTNAATETTIPNEAGQSSQVDLAPSTTFSSTPATAVIEPGSGKTPAQVELEKRRARAAKFGIPFEEPKTTDAASTDSTSTSKPVSQPKKEPASVVSAAPAGESEEALAKRRAKWGVVEKPGTMQKVKGKLVEKAEAAKAAVVGEKKEAVTDTKKESAPVEKTPQQIEDERKRLAREERFKTSNPVPVDNSDTANTDGGSLVMGVAPTLGESNGTEKRKIEEGTGDEPAEKKIKV